MRFHAKFSSQDEAYNNSLKTNYEIEREGFVLLKNEDNCLPLKPKAKISIFGRAGIGEAGIKTSILDAGFKINTVLDSFYSENPLERRGGGGRSPGFQSGELTISCYTEDVKNSFSEYNDAAIVIITRFAGEANDISRTSLYDAKKNVYGVWYDEINGICAKDKIPSARYATDHTLQLDKNEAALLKMCGDYFDNVIVVLNTGGKFECGFLDDSNHYAYHKNIKAAIWIGRPNNNFLNPLGEILNGTVNPSGRTVDIWSRDFKEDPTWMNFGTNLNCYSYQSKGNNYANISYTPWPIDKSRADHNINFYYVIYKEGIYYGYYYYETRAYVEGNEKWIGIGTYTEDASADGNGPIHGTTTTEWENWYSGHVVYPFGYGLSYTTFTQEVVEKTEFSGGIIEQKDTITFKVKVTNTGSVAGKEVVQLYYTSPYYNGGIEKAHVVLGDYAKTKLLQPGESEIVSVSIKVSDMKSYDYNDANNNGFKGYELEKGAYQIKLMKNSHDCIYSAEYKINKSIIIHNDEITGNEVINRFDSTSNFLTNAKDDLERPGLGEKYLSRSDFSGTYPTMAYRINAPQWVIDESRPLRDTPDTEEQAYYNNKMPLMNMKNGINFKELVGKSYNDSLWENFLDQLNVRQMKLIALFGGYQIGKDTKYHPGISYDATMTSCKPIEEESSLEAYQNTQRALAEIEQMGIMSTPSFDGPWGFCVKPIWTDIFGTPKLFNGYIGNCILAATFNNNLAYAKGEAIANEAILSRIGSWYAPGCNLHRSPFGGRNNEYFSEDFIVSGMMSAYIIKGSQDNGLLPFAKHFALNEQERDRHCIMTWANEQCMREQYFKPFEISVKIGNAHGIMNAMNRIGTVFVGESYELLHEVLRYEWGFEGVVVTDSGFVENNVSHVIRAGADLILCVGGAIYNASNATGINALRRATKNILYALSTSLATDVPIIDIKKENSIAFKIPITKSKIRKYSNNGVSVIYNNEFFVIDIEENIGLKIIDRNEFKEKVKNLISKIRDRYEDIKIVWTYGKNDKEHMNELIAEAFEEWCIFSCIDADKLYVAEWSEEDRDFEKDSDDWKIAEDLYIDLQKIFKK